MKPLVILFCFIAFIKAWKKPLDTHDDCKCEPCKPTGVCYPCPTGCTAYVDCKHNNDCLDILLKKKVNFKNEVLSLLADDIKILKECNTDLKNWIVRPTQVINP